MHHEKFRTLVVNGLYVNKDGGKEGHHLLEGDSYMYLANYFTPRLLSRKRKEVMSFIIIRKKYPNFCLMPNSNILKWLDITGVMLREHFVGGGGRLDSVWTNHIVITLPWNHHVSDDS